MTEHAYRAGAARVEVFYDDDHVRRSTVTHAPEAVLRTNLPWQYQALRDLETAPTAGRSSA